MSAPDPEGMSLLAKVIAAGTAVVAPIWGGMKWLDGRFDKKADRDDMDSAIGKIDHEFEIHRGYFAKVFDQMRDSEQRAQDRHERLMERLTGERK